MVQTELWSFFIAMGSLVVRRLSCSWDILLVLLRLCSSLPVPAAYLSVGFWKSFFVPSFFHSLAVSFLRLFLDSWLRLVSSCSIFYWGLPEWFSSVLCSSSSQLSFLANVCWGPGGVFPFGALASSHSPFAAILLRFKYLCLLLLVSFFAFSLHAASHF